MLSHPRVSDARLARGPALLALTLLVGFGLSLIALTRYPPNAAFVAGGPLNAIQAAGSEPSGQITDSLWANPSLVEPPQRVASAVLATDEMIAGLIAPERLVSVTPFVDDAGISNVAGHYPAHIARNRADHR